MIVGNLSELTPRRLAFLVFMVPATAVLVVALAVAEILLLTPEVVVRPATGYAVTVVLGALSLAGAWWFRRAGRWLTTVALATIVVCVTLNLVLLDGLFGSLLSLESPEATIYSEKYSGWRFWSITKGSTREQVLDSLGKPLTESWIYTPRSEAAASQVLLENDSIIDIERANDPRLTPVTSSMTRTDLLRVAGAPTEMVFWYSKGRNSHCERGIRFRKDRVVEKISYYYFD